MKTTTLLFVLFICSWQIVAAFDNLDTVWLKKYTRDIVKMKYSPDDKYLLTTNLVQGDVIAMPSGEPLLYFGGVSAMEWSKDGKWFVAWVVTGTGNKLVRYETGTWRAIDTIYLPTGDDVNHAMSLASDNRTLAISWSGKAKKTIQFYDLIERKLVKETVVKFEAMNSIYTPDTRYIISHGTDWQVRFFDIAEDSVVYTYQFGSGSGLLAMSEDGKTIAFSTHKKDIAIEVMDVATRQIKGQINENPILLTGIALTTGGSLLAAAFGELSSTYISVYKTSDMSVIAQATNSSFHSAEFSHSGQYLLCSVSNYLFLFNLQPVSVKEGIDDKTLESYPNPVRDILTVETEFEYPCIATVKIISSNGAEVQAQTLPIDHAGSNVCRIMVKELPSGSYTAIISSSHLRRTIRFIKL
ncbi:MAG: hypothetical protein IPM69_15425 [Ignavibacteria bacterium]|nr:hypothetical protein [Ignavibacteria bacterium]